jgi:CheY-like chemotaxis protein
MNRHNRLFFNIKQTPTFRVLMADDNECDRVLFRRSLRNCVSLNLIQEVDTGQKLKDYLDNALRNHSPLPDLLLLDDLMPVGNAMKILEWLSRHPVARMKTVVLSGSSRPDIKQEAMRLGAHDCYLKTADLPLLDKIAEEIQAHMLAGHYEEQNDRQEPTT